MGGQPPADMPPADRILIIDDPRGLVRALAPLLKKHGHRVVLRATVTKALAAVRASATRASAARTSDLRPDLILLAALRPDPNSPGGPEMCRHLQADPATRGIPILLVGALDSPDERARAFTAGAADFLAPPLHPDEMAARVRSQLALRRPSRQLQEIHANQRALLRRVAHDLRGPFADLTAQSQNLRQAYLGLDRAGFLEVLDNVERENHRTLGQLDELLEQTAARMERAARPPQRPQPPLNPSP